MICVGFKNITSKKSGDDYTIIKGISETSDKDGMYEVYENIVPTENVEGYPIVGGVYEYCFTVYHNKPSINGVKFSGNITDEIKF